MKIGEKMSNSTEGSLNLRIIALAIIVSISLSIFIVLQPMKAQAASIGSDLREVHLRMISDRLTPITPPEDETLHRKSVPNGFESGILNRSGTTVYKHVGTWRLDSIEDVIYIQQPVKFIIWLSTSGTTSGDIRFTLKYDTVVMVGPTELHVSGITTTAKRYAVSSYANLTTTKSGKPLLLEIEGKINGDGVMIEYGGYQEDSGVSFMCDAIKFVSLKADHKAVSVEFTDAFRASINDLFPVLIIDGNQIEEGNEISLSRSISDSGNNFFVWKMTLKQGEHLFHVGIAYDEKDINNTWSIQRSIRIHAVNYDQHYYDPFGDIQLVTHEGHFSTDNQWEDLDIIEMISSENTSGAGSSQKTEITLSITVKGIIQDNDGIIYAVYITSDSEEYFLTYEDKEAMGLNLNSGESVALQVSGAGTSTISFTIEDSTIGNPSSIFKWHGITKKRTDTKTYGDIAPNKLVKITEPWDRQTVYGTLTIKGEIRNSVLDMEKVEIQIDSMSSGGWEEIWSGGRSSSWDHDIDTTSLGDGMHTINVRATDSTGLEFKDSIDINVNTYSAINPAATDVKPAFFIGDCYNFEISQVPSDEPETINIDILTQSTMEVKVTEQDVDVDGTNCLELRSEQTGYLYVGNIEFDFETKGQQYLDQMNSDIVKESTELTLSSAHTQDETQMKTTIYDPPKVYYDFPIEVAKEWSGSTTAEIDLNGESSTENLNIKNRCIFSENIAVPAGSFECFAIRSQNSGATFYKVEYYAPNIGYPVRIETFDIDDNLIGVLVLSAYSIKDTFIEFTGDLDLIIENPDEKIFEGDELTFKVEVENTGLGSAEKALVKGFVSLADSNGEAVPFDQECLRLNAGVKDIINLVWTAQEAGHYVFYFYTYSYNNYINISDDECEYGKEVIVLRNDNTPPIANVSVNGIYIEDGGSFSAIVDSLAIFNASASLDNVEISNYIWSIEIMGNKFQLWGKEVQFIFNKTGLYSVNLTVRDSVGNYDNLNLNITVTIEDDDTTGDDDTTSDDTIGKDDSKNSNLFITIGIIVGIILILGILFLLIVMMKRRLKKDMDEIQILKKRLAKGEITKEEFDELRTMIKE